MDPRLRQWMNYRPSLDRVRPSYPGRSPYASPNSGNSRRISYPVSSPQQQPGQQPQPRRGCCGGRRLK